MFYNFLSLCFVIITLYEGSETTQVGNISDIIHFIE